MSDDTKDEIIDSLKREVENLRHENSYYIAALYLHKDDPTVRSVLERFGRPRQKK